MMIPNVLNSENVKAASMIGIAKRTKYCASGRFVSSAAVNASTKLRTMEPDVRICRPKWDQRRCPCLDPDQLNCTQQKGNSQHDDQRWRWQSEVIGEECMNQK